MVAGKLAEPQDDLPELARSGARANAPTDQGATMTRLKAVGVLFALACVFDGLTATSAFATLKSLPVFAPVKATETLTGDGATKATTPWLLATVGGSDLTGEGAKLATSTKGESSIGTFTLTLEHAKEGTNNCKISTSTLGTLPVQGKYAVVPTAIAGGLTTTAAILFKPEGLTVLCGTISNPEKVKIKVTGAAIGKQSTAIGVKTKSTKVDLKCTPKGKQNVTEYFNDAEAKMKETLKADFGLGAEQSCVNISEEVEVKFNKEVEIKA
jgi:hypothetical protein